MLLKALVSELRFSIMNLVTSNFSFLKHATAFFFFTKEALSGIQLQLGLCLVILMSNAERVIVKVQ
jgi:hypothetical protein